MLSRGKRKDYGGVILNRDGREGWMSVISTDADRSGSGMVIVHPFVW
jgi:hypothetical protein